MSEIPTPCQDCVHEPSCDSECIGHLTEAEFDALSKYLVWKYTNRVNDTFPEDNIEDAIERWR